MENSCSDDNNKEGEEPFKTGYGENSLGKPGSQLSDGNLYGFIQMTTSALKRTRRGQKNFSL